MSAVGRDLFRLPPDSATPKAFRTARLDLEFIGTVPALGARGEKCDEQSLPCQSANLLSFTVSPVLCTRLARVSFLTYGGSEKSLL